jgi:mannosyl-3-phosphoglycerate phosphatase
MTGKVPVVVFSDVDGVLRAPSAEALARARRALRQLETAGVGLVLCSMKTRAELELLQQELGLRQPFLAESGSAAFIPSGYFGYRPPDASERSGYEVLEFGPPYAEVIGILRATAAKLGVAIRGFSEMPLDAVAEACGVPLLRARLATLREYVEPFTVLDDSQSARTRLLRALASAGLETVTRGNYDYLGGVMDHVPGVRALRGLYDRTHGRVLAIGLVDSLSTGSLLPATDARVLLRGDEQEAGSIDAGTWADGLLQAVDELRRRHAKAEHRRGPAALHIHD